MNSESSSAYASSVMGETSSVSAAQKSAVQTQIQISLLAKQQSVTKQTGAAIVEMIQSAGQVGKSLNTGKVFDATA